MDCMVGAISRGVVGSVELKNEEVAGKYGAMKDTLASNLVA